MTAALLALTRWAADGLGIVTAGLLMLPLLVIAQPPGARRVAAALADPDRPATPAPGPAPAPVPVAIPDDPEAAAALTAARRLAIVGAAAWLPLALAALIAAAADAAGTGFAGLGSATLVRFVTEVPAGRGAALTVLVAAGLLTWLTRTSAGPPRLPELPVGVALIGLVARPLAGHAAAAAGSAHAGHQPAALLLTVHVGAVTLWVGGLAAVRLAVVGRTGLLAVALPRFSRLAGWCLALVAVTGVSTAAVLLPSVPALWTSGYGRLVLAKSAALAGLAALGWHARRRLLDAAAADGAGPARRPAVGRWLTVELGLMALTVALAAVLADSSPR